MTQRNRLRIRLIYCFKTCFLIFSLLFLFLSSAAAKPAASSVAKKPSAAPAAKKPAAKVSGGSHSSAELNDLTDQLSTLRVTIEGLEKERNFYFGKLREIEIVCQDEAPTDLNAAQLKQQVLAIL